MVWISQKILEVQLGNYQLLNLEFADERIEYCESITNLESTLNIYCKEAAKLDLRVNWSKTKLMHIGGNPDPPTKWTGV